MSFYTIITEIGQAKFANAVALDEPVGLAEMAVGDGGGSAVTPTEGAESLVREVYRNPLNRLEPDADNPNYLIAELVIPSTKGGWTVREVGIFDDAGDLIAYANFPETYKPVLAEGSTRDLIIRIVMEVSDTSAVELKIDPTVVLASRDYVDQAVAGASTASISGPETVYPGQTVTYSVTNYDSFKNYEASSTVGAVTISGDTLQLAIPSDAPAGTATLAVTQNGNQAACTLIVEEKTVAQPSMFSPSDGATDVSGSPALTSSAFETIPSGADNHASTDWQVATDAAFTNIVWESLGDADNLETVQVPAGALSPSTSYYARVRHNGETLGSSGWSDESHFTTSSSFAPSGEIAKLLASDTVSSSYFGHSVAISADGGTAVIGARGSSTIGAAYIFSNESGTWQEVAKLEGSDAIEAYQFGRSVSISDDGSMVAVGAHAGINYPGAAYIFSNESGTWQEVAKLTSDGSASNDYFGISVAVSGDGSTVVIGDSRDDSQSSDAGAAYVFSNATGSWQQVEKLTAADARYLGVVVSVSGDGGTVAALDTKNQGAAYIFSNESGTWQEVAKLAAGDGADLESALSVSNNGSVVMVGSQGHNTSAGAAYVFSNAMGSWQQVEKLTAADASDYEYFGCALSLNDDGSLAAIGARGDGLGGAVHILSNSGGTWQEIEKFKASDEYSGHAFGSSVAISGNGSTAVIGVSSDDEGGAQAGAAYIFA